jgi:succinate-semialdehyde dehydrogenase/glutarate-semialdehyde dehydrogenase
MAIFESIPGDAGQRRYRVKSPVTLEPIGEFDAASRGEVRAAVERARKAQASWAALSFDGRAKFMWRLLDQLVERQDEIIDAVVQETGKARSEAIAMEVFAPCASIAYYAKRAGRILAPTVRRPAGIMGLAKKVRLVYKPLGVVGLITPWNGPVALAVNPMVQALMAGNAVVHKPSEVTPFSALLVKSLTEAAGLPEDLYQVIQGDGQTGADLIDAGVDKISFTGSAATGRKVAAACGERLIPVTLELGGKDAMIVCADADLEAAAKGAVMGSCMNTGHYCCGTERIYVVEPVYDEFLEKVVEQTRALRQSDSGECDVGAVFWDKQMDIIERHMADAREKGAEVLVGGGRNPALGGLYFQPTVVTNVSHEMQLMRDETFGPILAVQKVKDEAEALRLANDSDYGLDGNVWTRDLAKGARLAEQMETGGVCVNDMAVTYGIPEAPFGGVKSSGVGQVNGEIGLKGYTHPHPIVIGKKGQSSYPYTRKTEAGMQKFIRLLFGTRIGRLFT